MPPASTNWAALSRESIPWNQGYPERGWSPSLPSDSPWNRNDPSGRREGGKSGYQGSLPHHGRRKVLFSLPASLPSPSVRSLRIPRKEFQVDGHRGVKAEMHSHLWYLWLFPECPGVGRGPRGDDLSLLGVPLQWGCGGATLGEAIPLSQNGRRQWRQNWGRWMPRDGLRGHHTPLEKKYEGKVEN